MKANRILVIFACSFYSVTIWTTTSAIPIQGGNANGETTEVLRETNATIQSAQLHLYRQKTQLSLNFLDTLIPLIQSIQSNMSHLLESTSNARSGSSLGSMSVDPNPFQTYKETQDNLDKELMGVETRMSDHRRLLEQYSVVYKNAEELLFAFHAKLGSLLLPQQQIQISEPADLQGGTSTHPPTTTTAAQPANSTGVESIEITTTTTTTEAATTAEADAKIATKTTAAEVPIILEISTENANPSTSSVIASDNDNDIPYTYNIA